MTPEEQAIAMYEEGIQEYYVQKMSEYELRMVNWPREKYFTENGHVEKNPA